MSANEEHTQLLQELITTCRDGQIGYRDAAAHIKDAKLKTFFEEKSLQRAQFAGELEQEEERLGKHDPNRKGSIAGSLQRAWFDFSAGPLGGGDASIVEGVTSRELETLNTYKRAASAELPSYIKEIVDRQMQVVAATHQYVSQLHPYWKGAMIV